MKHPDLVIILPKKGPHMKSPFDNMKMPAGKMAKKAGKTPDEEIDALFGPDGGGPEEGSPEEEAGESPDEEASEDSDVEEALADFSDDELKAELDRRKMSSKDDSSGGAGGAGDEMGSY